MPDYNQQKTVFKYILGKLQCLLAHVLNSTNGMVKSFQVHMKERIATVAVVGFRTGKMILEKI